MLDMKKMDAAWLYFGPWALHFCCSGSPSAYNWYKICISLSTGDNREHCSTVFLCGDLFESAIFVRKRGWISFSRSLLCWILRLPGLCMNIIFILEEMDFMD
jgi:hypothetical protein